MEQFYLKPRIYTGRDSLDALEGLEAERVLVVTDPFWSQGGVSQVVKKLSSQVRIFDQVTGEPDTEMAAKGVAMFQEFQPQAMVALGGGRLCAGLRQGHSEIRPAGEPHNSPVGNPHHSRDRQ